MRRCLLAAIRLYQRFISPHKGFACAYRVHTGHPSCSSLGYRAVRRYGAWGGLLLIRQRTHLCGVAHRRYGAATFELHPQRGVCDAGCDLPCDAGCDLPDLSGCDFGDAACSGCDCDGPDRRRRKNREAEKYVYIPPQVQPPAATRLQ